MLNVRVALAGRVERVGGVHPKKLLKDVREEVVHKLIKFLDQIREDWREVAHEVIEDRFAGDLLRRDVNYPTSRDGCWRAVIQIVRLNDDSHLFGQGQ